MKSVELVKRIRKLNELIDERNEIISKEKGNATMILYTIMPENTCFPAGLFTMRKPKSCDINCDGISGC